MSLYFYYIATRLRFCASNLYQRTVQAYTEIATTNRAKQVSYVFPSFAFHSSVRNLGVVLDSTLTFSEHVANLTRSSYFHLRRLRAIRRSVSSHVFPSIVHAFVCSRIDYCNTLLVGLPKVRLSLIVYI